MITINAEIKGLDVLIDGVKKMPRETVEYVSDAVKKSVLVVQSNAIKEAPVNKQSGGGNLRQSIKTSMVNKLRGAIISNANYSIFVHEGTRPHVIRPRIKKGLANKRTGQFFGKIVHHPGTRANPYMERAYEKSKERISGFFNDAVDKVAKLLTR